MTALTALQTYWNTDDPENQYIPENDSEDDTKCHTVIMTAFDAKLTLCGQDDGSVRIDVIVPDTEDLSGNTGLCGNANGIKSDDPDALPSFVTRLHPTGDGQ